MDTPEPAAPGASAAPVPAERAGAAVPSSSVDPDTFKAALSRFAAGVVVVTARETDATSDTPSGDEVGMTATAFLSVSLEPPLVLVSLRNVARMREVLDAQPLWAVSLLSQGQRHVAGRFAIPGRVSDRLMFADIAHRPGPLTGAPLVGGALATLECRTHQIVEAGDHSLVIGEVLAANLPSPDGLPLLHFRGRYRSLG
ncbi:flavin reductase family protein [Yinghuangia seranimata]|uniref:flavin reductase family protein n=1 Tax=Yinghuangia seranimata TaxID=408067 RepID=UPI003CCF9D3A